MSSSRPSARRCRAAIATAGAFDPAAVAHSLEIMADGHQVVWFEIPLAASTTLVDYTLDVGQSPSEDPATPSLADQGLRLGAGGRWVDSGDGGSGPLTLRVPAGQEEIVIELQMGSGPPIRLPSLRFGPQGDGEPGPAA